MGLLLESFGKLK